MTAIKDLKTFSFIWSGLFFTIGIITLFKGGNIRIWAIIISLIFLIIGLISPKILHPFYKIWTKVGEFIGGIISKIILAILFFGFFAPVAFVLRFFKKDLLDKNIDKTESSYWIVRETQPESMKNQF